MDNLYASPVLMVEQPRRLSPDSYYHVYDGNGMPMAHVRELMPTGRFAGGGRYRPHRFGIFSTEGEPILTLDKPWQNGLPNIYVTDSHGGPVGCIMQDMKFTGSRFWLQDAQGQNIGRIEGDFGNWHFEVYDAHGTVVAQIDKQYTGLLSGQWHVEDRYALQFHYDPDEWLRLLVVSAAVTVDALLHDFKRDTSFYAYGAPSMWVGDPFYFDRPGFWGPRAGWDGYFGYYGPRWYGRHYRGGRYYGRRIYGPRWHGGRYVGARYYRPRPGVRYRPRVARGGYRATRSGGVRAGGAPRSGGVARGAGRPTGARRGNDGVDRRSSRGAASRGAAPGSRSQGGAGGKFGPGAASSGRSAPTSRGRSTGSRSTDSSASRGQASGGRGGGFGASVSRGRPSGARGGFGGGGSRGSSGGRSGGGLFGGGGSRGSSGGRSGGGRRGGGGRSRGGGGRRR